MNKQQLLNQLRKDLTTCKPSKAQGINLIITMLNKCKGNNIESPYNLGQICECIIKAHFTNNNVKPSPKGVDDINIDLTTTHINKYFNGVSANLLDVKFINNYSTAHKPTTRRSLVCVTPKGCYMADSEKVEYNDSGKIILSSVYANGSLLENLTELLGL